MYFKSKLISLLTLGVTAIVCSRTMFAFFDDPEGPNLLIVMVLAAILYSLSLIVYVWKSPIVGFKRLLVGILIQIAVVISLYFLLR